MFFFFPLEGLRRCKRRHAGKNKLSQVQKKAVYSPGREIDGSALLALDPNLLRNLFSLVFAGMHACELHPC